MRHLRNSDTFTVVDNDRVPPLDVYHIEEDYVRPLTDYEKPLVLQSFWKPLDGYCRRFEIRKRSMVIIIFAWQNSVLLVIMG